jgi:hypothetical protein
MDEEDDDEGDDDDINDSTYEQDELTGSQLASAPQVTQTQVRFHYHILHDGVSISHMLHH